MSLCAHSTFSVQSTFHTKWRVLVMHCTICSHLHKRLLAACFFDDPDSFYDVLSDCCGIFSGSTAWTLSNIDLYVGGSVYWKLGRWLVGQDFFFLHVGDRHPSQYSHPEISRVASIDVVVSNTETIFKFHSTSVMSFVSGDRIFYGYPRPMQDSICHRGAVLSQLTNVTRCVIYKSLG